MSDVWDPERYERFRAERAQPFRDLLALVERRPAMRAVDLGCGTGDMTGDLHRELAARDTVGIDRSQATLARPPGDAGPSCGEAGTCERPPPPRLDPRDWQGFFARYCEMPVPQLADERPFLYTYPRLLFWGQRG